LIEKGLVRNKSYYDISKDIITVVTKTYVHFNEKEVFKVEHFGKYFPEIFKNPTKYIYEQKELRTTL
jgi:hypothetical protein